MSDARQPTSPRGARGLLPPEEAARFGTAARQAAGQPASPVPVIADDAQALAIARELAGEFAAGAQERDRDRILPWREVERFSGSGLWGITVPREYGGAGVSSRTLAQVIAIVSAADGSLGHIPQNHFYSLEVLRVGGTPAQQAFFYERALRGERFGNALAEIGRNDYRRTTRLERDGGNGWFVQGRKFYCTGALFAHWIPTVAAGEDAQGPTEYMVFIPREAPGVSVADDWDGFGQRVTGSGTVAFDRVRVQPEWVLPFKASFERPTTIGPFAQILHAAIDAGIGRGAFQATLDYVREHARPWIDAGVERAADDPLLLYQVGEAHVRLRAAEALIERAARFVDAAQAAPGEDSVAAASVAVAEAKALATTASLLAGNRLFELAGTSATSTRLGLDRYWRNARTHTLHDPVRWKHHAVGNYALNGKRPPRHGAI